MKKRTSPNQLPLPFTAEPADQPPEPPAGPAATKRPAKTEDEIRAENKRQCA